VPGAGPVRANLWASDRLASYAFSVEAAIGQNPMRYLVARRFDRDSQTHALTMLFVLQPQVLSGTYVRIIEDAFGGRCEVDTYLPTMARPVRVAEAQIFDCLPLTDVGYVDLMAWPHPALRQLADGNGDRDAEPLGSPHAATVRYQGPASLPTLEVHEEVDLELSMVVRRVIRRDGRPVRRWEITERGGTGQETLPRRIRVSRPQTRHETEFVRASPAVPVPPAVFDAGPEQLRECIEQQLR